MARFIPRNTFTIPNSIPKTYFLGHHQAGANKIKTLLPLISLVLECRDFRLPLSTQNPHLERTLSAGRHRILIFTKSDLGTSSPSSNKINNNNNKINNNNNNSSSNSNDDPKTRLRRIYGSQNILFWDKSSPKSTDALLSKLKSLARNIDSLTGLRALVVGMPNVGKSTLLNALRSRGGTSPGQKKSKAAKTGDQAGVTRKVSTAVRIIDGDDKPGGVGSGVYIMDTPGIFQPYVEDGETMIKVALAHGIKKGLIQDEILVDYLLYRMNQVDPSIYQKYCPPTNDVNQFLAAVAQKEGRLRTGGLPNISESAARVLSLWRDGKMGRFVLDALEEEDIRAHEMMLAEPSLSVNQARKMQKEERKQVRMDS